MDKIDIIIPCAGMGLRTGLKKPKCLLKFRNIHMILRQIGILKKNYKCNITVVTGFESCKVREILPKDVNEIYNKNYENTNVAYSIGLALKEINCKNALIFYGDLIYSNNIKIDCSNNYNYIAIDNNNDKNGIGVSVTDGIINHFNYGLPFKWSHISKINEIAISYFKTIVEEKQKYKWFSFELFNKMIEDGHKFYPININGLKVIEINNLEDLKLANKII